MNYRVGVIGYLALPELTRESPHHASGNYGLLDQIAALRWVRSNIAKFGGDPNRVAVAGQSAGSIAVHEITASPLASGLLQRAIMESGGSSIGDLGIRMPPKSLADAEYDGENFMHSVSAASLAELRAMPWQKLLAAQQGVRFAPIVDGYSLPAPVATVFREGKQHDVVSLTGINVGELQGLTGPSGANMTVEQYQQQAKKKYGTRAEEFLKLYPAGNAEQLKSALLDSARDGNVAAMYLWARERAKTSKTPVYEYLWDHALPGPDASHYGAFHSSELPYVLNTLGMSDRPFTAEDEKIATIMSSYWANFAASGDPNGRGLSRWQAVSSVPEVMQVGNEFQEVPVAGSNAKFEFWKSVLTEQ
jgi:para-nitrobenzyl esterase